MTAPNINNPYLPGTIQIPSALTITAITQSNPMVVTTSANNLSQVDTYIPGQNVRLTVPISYGMFQADGLVGTILAVSGANLSLDIDSSLFDAFVPPVDPPNALFKSPQPATLAPSGSRNLSFSNSTNQIAFQSLNNIGN